MKRRTFLGLSAGSLGGTALGQTGGRTPSQRNNTAAFEDELYDLDAVEARNLAPDPQSKQIREEMITRMGRFLSSDPRWIGYWHSFRVDHYWNLPREKAGDYQMFRPQ